MGQSWSFSGKTIIVKLPSGAKYEITGPIGINDFGGGGANDIGSFSATLNSNGAPVLRRRLPLNQLA